MEKTGLLYEIFTGVYRIDLGRKGLDTDGNEHDGRLFYENGITTVMRCFQEAQKATDCELLILAEETFLEQELHFYHVDDTITRNSLIQAIQDLENASDRRSARCLKTVEVKTLYQAAETTYSTTKTGSGDSQGILRTFGPIHQACIGPKSAPITP